MTASSPDFLDSAKTQPPVRRATRAGHIIVFVFMAVAVILLIIGFHHHQMDVEEVGKREEEVQGVKTIPPPVKPEDARPKPTEPDMPTPPEMRMNNPPSHPEPARMPDYLKKRLEEDRAASQSPVMVQAFSKPSQNQQPVSESRLQESKQDSNLMDRKEAFLEGKSEPRYSVNRRTDPIAPGMELVRGTNIPAVMMQSVNSDLPGQIIAQVSENVYDSATGKNLLIPAGAKVNLAYDSAIAFGQNRLLIAGEEIVFPDGSYLQLDRMPGVDAGGSAGVGGNVNNHYMRIIGSAALLSLFSAASQLTQPRGASAFGGYNAQQILAAAMGREISMTGRMFLQRELNIQPTLEIPFGTKFNIAVSQAIVFDRVWER